MGSSGNTRTSSFFRLRETVRLRACWVEVCSLLYIFLWSSLHTKLGDYDGDKVTVIWQPEIVEFFRNADPSFADPPKGIQDKFVKNTETVDEFLRRVPSNSANTKTHTREIQKYTLGALKDWSIVGKYSKMHDYAVYMLGYSHEESIRLAYMWVHICRLLQRQLIEKLGSVLVLMVQRQVSR